MDPLIKSNPSDSPAAPDPNNSSGNDSVSVHANNPASAATPPIDSVPTPEMPAPAPIENPAPAPEAPTPQPAPEALAPKAPIPETLTSEAPAETPMASPAPISETPAPEVFAPEAPTLQPAPEAPTPAPEIPPQPARSHISGQHYRGNGHLRASGFTANSGQQPDSSAPLAQPITPTSIDDAPIILNNDAKKPASNKITILVTILVVIIAFAGGVAVGHFLLGGNENIGGTNNVPTPEPTATDVKPAELTADEKTELSEKVSWLLMAEDEGTPATAESFGVGVYNTFPELVGSNLTDAHKLGIAVYSLRDKYTSEFVDYTNENGEVIQDAYTIGPSVDEVNARFKEIFDAEPVYAQSDYCPFYVLDESRNAYLINNACGGATVNVDLFYKSTFELADDGASVTVAVGSAVYEADATTGEAVGVYNDYRTSTTKTLLMPETDFSTPEELAAFNITSENADQFTQYEFLFTEDDDGNFVFDQVQKL